MSLFGMENPSSEHHVRKDSFSLLILGYDQDSYNKRQITESMQGYLTFTWKGNHRKYMENWLNVEVME